MTTTSQEAPTEHPAPLPPTSTQPEARIDRTPKRIRVFLAGRLAADTIAARLAYATGRHPGYLLPVDDVLWSDLTSDDATEGSDSFGEYHPVRISSKTGVVGRLYTHGAASGLVSFDFEKMDAWFEEDEQISFHPRDPFRRVDVVESSRHIEVAVNGTVVASSDRPRLVTETGLPERWYVPRADVDWSRLVPSTTSSGCQYKGLADWWHVSSDEAEQLADVVWGYERPVPEAAKLAGLVAFYAEHAAVDTCIDGELQLKPKMDVTALNPSLGLVNIPAHADR